MTWLTIGRLFLEIVSRVAGYLRDKQLLDAGEAKATARMSAEEQRRVDDANRAAVRARATVDAHGVPDDAFRD